jgi:5'-3' exonuclease
VFDGQAPPAKERVHKERKQKYEENKRLAIAAHRATDKKQFATFVCRAIRIAAPMNEELKRLLRLLDIAFVVAPGEADAMAAALVRIGNCYAAISDDSDLIVFGCPRVLYKLNADGIMKEYEEGRLEAAYTIPQQLRTVEHLRIMSVLSGCDYCEGLHGVGLQRAALLVVQYPTVKELVDYLRDHAHQYKFHDGFVTEMDIALALFKARDVPAGVWELRGALSAAEREMFAKFVEDHPDLCRKWKLDPTSTYDLWDPPGADHPPPTTAAAAAVGHGCGSHRPRSKSCITASAPMDPHGWHVQELQQEVETEEENKAKKMEDEELVKAAANARVQRPRPRGKKKQSEDKGRRSICRFWNRALEEKYSKFHLRGVVLKEASADVVSSPQRCPPSSSFAPAIAFQAAVQEGEFSPCNLCCRADWLI